MDPKARDVEVALITLKGVYERQKRSESPEWASVEPRVRRYLDFLLGDGKKRVVKHRVAIQVTISHTAQPYITSAVWNFHLPVTLAQVSEAERELTRLQGVLHTHVLSWSPYED